MTAPGAAGENLPEVLAVDDLRVRFGVRDESGRRRQLQALAGVSFGIARGETLGLVGESGCGKSTLVRTLFGLNPVQSGSVRVFGQDLATLSPRQRRATRSRMQLVFQDPYSSLDPRMTVGEIVAEPLRIAGRYRAERVAEVLRAVGLGEEVLGRRPATFSGGQRQRIGIARALTLEPDLLVLDEPVSALDVSVQAQVINLLRDLQARLGLAYLFVAHDLSVVRHISHRVAVMHLGRVVELGTRAQIFGDPQHPYTRALLSAVPPPDPRLRGRARTTLVGEAPNPTDAPQGCTFRSRCPAARPDCADGEPPLRSPDPARSAVACFHPARAQEAVPLLVSPPPAAPNPAGSHP